MGVSGTYPTARLKQAIERLLFEIVPLREYTITHDLALYPMKLRYLTTKTEQGARRVRFCEVPPQMRSKSRE